MIMIITVEFIALQLSFFS